MNKWQPRCPRCKSLNIYYQLLAKTYFCRRCGCVFTRDNKIVKEGG